MMEIDQWLRKLVIASEDIPHLFEELTLLGVRKYSLFPDLSALTSELRTIHLPREA